MFQTMLRKSISANFKNPMLYSQNLTRCFCHNLIKSEIVVESTSTTQHKKVPVKIYFFGNEDISLPTLEMLYKKKFVKRYLSKPVEAEPFPNENKFLIDVVNVSVVTTPWQNGNKKQATFHTFCSAKKIEMFEIAENSWESLNKNIKLEETPEVQASESKAGEEQTSIKKMGIVFSFGKMIPESTINLFHTNNNLGIYILHPSLLPKYRGGAPIQHTLLNQESETGVSLIHTKANEFDTGSIIMQTKVPVEYYYRFKELSTILASEGTHVVEKFIENYQSYIFSKASKSQSEVEVNPELTKAKIIKDKMFVFLDFSCDSNKNILRIYHAFQGSQLPPWTQIKYGTNIKLLFFDNLFNASPSVQNILNNDEKIKEYLKPGSIYWDFGIDKDHIYIKTKESWLVSSTIKLEGLNWLDASGFTKAAFRNQKFEKNKKETHASVIQKSKIKPPK